MKLFSTLNGVYLYVLCWVFLHQLCWELHFVIWRCACLLPWACLIPGQVPRCKFLCSVYVVDLLLLLLLDCLPSNLFSMSFQLPHIFQRPDGSGTIRNICLQENRLEQLLLLGANIQGYLFAQVIVAGTKVGFAKTWLKYCAGAWCWSVMCSVETWCWFSKGCCRCSLSAWT